MKIKNINGTDLQACEGCSWLEHWIRFSRSKSASLCKQEDCISIATSAVLVQKADSSDPGWYVVPLCHKHAKAETRELELFGTPVLAPATVEKSCRNRPALLPGD